MCSQKNLMYILLSLPGVIGQQYHWQPSQCPTACGLTAPVVKCVDSYGQASANSLCNSYTKPSCHATPPCAPFWFSGDVQCPTECGRPASTLTRPVQCKGTIDGVVQVIAASYCDSYNKPSNTVQCSATPACVTYQWKLGEETCPTVCGLLASDVTRSLKCISSAGNVVDDSYCDAYAKPDTTLKCPATLPCAPFWFTSEVHCPDYCGSLETQQTRTVQCKGTINNMETVIADSYCATPKPSSSVPCAATAPCAPFWQASDVQCPSYCGLLASTQPRTVTCRGTINNQVVDIAESYCAASSKPSMNVDCQATTPCAPFWKTSDVQCPTYCGLLASTQPRTVTCQGTINNVVVVIADSYCDASSKPSTTVDCSATAPCAPFWRTSDVQCPTYCGLLASTQPRAVTCQGTINNVVVVIADSYCDASSKPSTTVDCSATAPCAPFWKTSDVQCPTYCGLLASTQPRAVTCQGTINNVVVVISDSYCDASSKPSTTVDCSATAPCAPVWSTSDVQCPSYCGLLSSNVPRTVQCKGTVNNMLIVIADSYCDAASKPSPTVVCPATAPCAPFWSTSDVTCPDYCGLLASQQTRTVQCKGTINGNVIVIADSYCDAGSKPSPSVTCAATAPCAPFWYTSDVYCPTECGSYGADMPRTVLCKGTVNGMVVVIADSYCSLPKPASSVHCPATNECVSYEWRVSSEYCPTECGRLAGTVSLTVTCVAKTPSNSAGTPVADSFCSYQAKPSTTLNCPATPPCSPFWLASPVNCPTYCGTPASTVTRLVECRGTVNGQVIVIAEHFCSGPKPSTTVPCAATPVCVIYKWKLGEASCPTDCGLYASQVMRPLACVAITPDNTVGSTVADSFCDANTKPDATLQCPETEACCATTDTPCSSDEECCTGVCVIPAYPAETAQPAYPAETSQPAYPAETSQPAYPAETSQPAYPAETSQPAYPAETSQPAYPAETSQPAYPAYPSSPGSKGTKSTKGTKDSKGTKGTKGLYDSEPEQPYKSTKGTKATKGTKLAKSSSTGSSNSYGGSATSPKSTKGKDAKSSPSSGGSTYNTGSSSAQSGKGKKRGYEAPRGTCGCLNNAASCVKDAQCCSGNCKNSVCTPKSTYVQSSGDDSSQHSGNTPVALGLGGGGALGAALVVGFVMRRRRRAKQMSREDRAASEPLTPHTKASTTPRKVDVVA